MPIDNSGNFKMGCQSTEWLRSVGISNIEQVMEIGIVDTCKILRKAGFPVSLNMAYGLQGDLMGIAWNKIPSDIRQELAMAYKAVMD